LKKILLFIFLFVIAFCSGCVSSAKQELRGYFFNEHSIDLTFAQKLKECKGYETPNDYSRYYGYFLGLIPQSKEKVKILGMDKENRCVIRSYKAGYLSPVWKKDYEYHMPKYVLPYFSDIFITAFSEPYMKEEKAIEKVHTFCNKYKDFCNETDKEHYPELINYIRNFAVYSTLSDKYKYYDEQMPNCYPLKGGYCRDVKFD
jgi:hypothetical protein